MEEIILTPQEASKLLKVSVQTIKNMIKKKNITGIKIGNITRILLDSLPIEIVNAYRKGQKCIE